MKNKYDKELLEKFSKISLSKSELLRKLGISTASGNFKTLKKYIMLYNIDISHFTGQGWNRNKKYKPYNKNLYKFNK